MPPYCQSAFHFVHFFLCNPGFLIRSLRKERLCRRGRGAGTASTHTQPQLYLYITSMHLHSAGVADVSLCTQSCIQTRHVIDGIKSTRPHQEVRPFCKKKKKNLFFLISRLRCPLTVLSSTHFHWASLHPFPPMTSIPLSLPEKMRVDSSLGN